MFDLEFVLAVLEDYCELQTSGLIPGANRYPVSDVQEQMEMIELGKMSDEVEIQELLQLSESELVATVVSQRNQIKKLQPENEKVSNGRDEALTASDVGVRINELEHIAVYLAENHYLHKETHDGITARINQLRTMARGQ